MNLRSANDVVVPRSIADARVIYDGINPSELRPEREQSSWFPDDSDARPLRRIDNRSTSKWSGYVENEIEA
jgi:hypothetical protein